MKVAIMQPYFFPYISYFQLISAVDIFYFHDDSKYTKKGFINRNFIEVNREPFRITLPLKNSSDFESIKDKIIAPSFNPKSILRTLQVTYGKSDHFSEIYPIVSDILLKKQENLSKYLANGIITISEYLEIKSRFFYTSELNLVKLRNSEKIISICKFNDSAQYINPIGGLKLYNRDYFLESGVQLNFIESKVDQVGNKNKYSIIHSLFTLGKEKTKLEITDSYKII
jgi:hypothetical protein